MPKRTIVAIYEVDGEGVTGARVGAGSLVDEQLVLLHPPLSAEIDDGHGPQRLRAGIRSDLGENLLVEVIDGQGAPKVLGAKDTVGPLVALELRTAATSPVDVMNGLRRVGTMDELVDLAVPLLASEETDGWNGSGQGVAQGAANVFCRICGWPC